MESTCKNSLKTIYTILGLSILLLLSACSDQPTPETDPDKDKVQADSVIVTRDTVWEGDTIVSISIVKEGDYIKSEEIFERSFTLGRLPSLKYTHITENIDSTQNVETTTWIHFNVPSSNTDEFLKNPDFDILCSYPIYEFDKMRYIKLRGDSLSFYIQEGSDMWILQDVEKPALVYVEDIDSMLTSALDQNPLVKITIDSLGCKSKTQKVLDGDYNVLEVKKKIGCDDVYDRKWRTSLIDPDTVENAKIYFTIRHFIRPSN